MSRKKEKLLSQKQNFYWKTKILNFWGETFLLERIGKNPETELSCWIQRQSPNGIINDKVSPLKFVTKYENSVQIRFQFSLIKIFGGNFDDILSVENHINIPILRKDFMVDEYQFWQIYQLPAMWFGMIAACLSPTQVQNLLLLTNSNLEVLLEIHTEEELKHFNSEIDLVGINNRNLKDFKVDLQHSVNLKNLHKRNFVRLPKVAFTIWKMLNFERKRIWRFLDGRIFYEKRKSGNKFKEFVDLIICLFENLKMKQQPTTNNYPT